MDQQDRPIGWRSLYAIEVEVRASRVVSAVHRNEDLSPSCGTMTPGGGFVGWSTRGQNYTVSRHQINTPRVDPDPSLQIYGCSDASPSLIS